MKVQITIGHVTEDAIRNPGDEHDLPDHIAIDLVVNGYAVEVATVIPSSAPETATRKPAKEKARTRK